ncbi:MAG: hypothetical protein K2Y02_01600 [Burkholderiaceae bacterium]|nr:hypothetical protein [Burkholderiaceae bacterium]
MTHDTTPSRRSRYVFAAFFVCSALTAAVAGTFFVIGLGDGSVSSFNLGLWLALLAVMGGSLWAGRVLRSKGKSGLAIAALAITAVPGLVAALFILLLLVTQPRWN